MMDRMTLWSTDRIYSLCVLVVSACSILIWANRMAPDLGHWYLTTLFCAVHFWIISKLSERERLSMQISTFIAGTLVLISESYSVYLASFQEADIHLGFYKFFAIMTALIAPGPMWISSCLISLCLFIPPIEALMISAKVHPLQNSAEPWLSIVSVLLSYLVLWYRLETQKTQDALIRADAKSKSLRDFAEISIALRDLMNTPIQTLTFLSDLLDQEAISPKNAAAQLKAANQKIQEVIHILNENSKKLNLPSPPESADSFAVLRRKLLSEVSNRKDPDA